MKKPRWPSAIVLAMLTLLAACMIQQPDVLTMTAAREPAQVEEIKPSPELVHANALSEAFRQVSRATLPAVVSIKTTGKVVRQRVTRRQFPFEDDPFFRQFFDDPRFREFREEGGPSEREYRMPGGQGSGFIIDADGLVMTNAHVVADAEEVIVRLADGREFTAVDVKSDERSDVAVVRIKVDEKLPWLRLGDDDRMEIGDWVLAFGSPFGMDHTVTQGIVSAKGRGLGSGMVQEFIQTDAAINPGNSGGPLVNLRGEVIGINTAISTRSGGYDGVSLAVPVNLARWVADQLKTTGEVRRAYVGITMQQIDAELANAFHLQVPRGVVVTGVVRDSPAAEAGFQEGDVILEVDGKRITSDRNMLGVVEKLNIGQTYSIRILRDNREQELKIKVAERPADLASLEGVDSSRNGSDNEASAEFTQVGITVQNLTEDLAQRLGMNTAGGVVITSVARNSPAARVGLSPGMVITRVGSRNVDNISDMEEAMKTTDSSNQVLFLVKISDGRSNISRFVTVPLSDSK
ncbi:MAG: Do family serine endopeptidase [Fuerstiella sp.]